MHCEVKPEGKLETPRSTGITAIITALAALGTGGCRQFAVDDPNETEEGVGSARMLDVRAVEATPPYFPEAASDHLPIVVEARTDPPDDNFQFSRQYSLHAWTSLMDSGCDLEAFHVWTPIEARILRHVPLVLHGHTIEAAELRAFFEHDGALARTPDGTAEPIPANERTCMNRLRQRERELRAWMPVPAKAEPLFTTPCVFGIWRSWADSSGPTPGASPYGKPHHGAFFVHQQWLDYGHPGDSSGWTWRSTIPWPECTSGKEECGGYIITAYPDGACEAVSAG